MAFSKLNTAKTFLLGPILDADGVAKTNEVVANINVTKNGTVGAAHGSSTLTHDHTGTYKYAANAGDFDTLGEVSFSLDSGTNAMASKSFDVIPAPTFNSLAAASGGNIPQVVAGGANGLFIAGTNAATAITTALTANIIGNITGTVSGNSTHNAAAVWSAYGNEVIYSDLRQILGHAITQTGTQLADGFEHFFDHATPAITVGDAMVGTDGANTVVPPSVAQFEARSIVAASYFVVGDYTVAPTTAQIVTAMEINGSKLDHLWEMTEDDGGTRRLTTNALEQGPDSDTTTGLKLASDGLGQVTAWTVDITGSLSGSVGSLTGHTNQSGDGYAIVNHGTYGLAALNTDLDQILVYADVIDNGTSGLVKVASDVAAILAGTGTDGVLISAGTGTGQISLSSGVVSAALASSQDVYHADIEVTIDETNSKDEYTVTWFKNGVRQTSGITVPKIQVVKRADGLDLVAQADMTQIGSTGSYKYDEDTDRLTAGEAALVVVSATIDASGRTFSRIVTRDSSE